MMRLNRALRAVQISKAFVSRRPFSAAPVPQNKKDNAADHGHGHHNHAPPGPYDLPHEHKHTEEPHIFGDNQEKESDWRMDTNLVYLAMFFGFAYMIAVKGTDPSMVNWLSKIYA